MIAAGALFEEHRRPLWALLYRMTGSAADADDLLQETFTRYLERPPARLDLPMKPWLAKVAVNLARDRLRARRRLSYTGAWLPEPIETHDETAPASFDPGAEWRYDLLESVSFAFLLALEALTPSQRAALLLRDVFDYSVRETADALELSEANVKQLHLRAKKKMDAYHAKQRRPTAEVQAETMRALGTLMQKIAERDVPGIEALLAGEVRVWNDSNGEFRAATRVVRGPENAAAFLLGVTRKGGTLVHAELRMLNGAPAFLVQYANDGRRYALQLTFAIELDAAGKVSAIYSVLASKKLRAINFAALVP